MKNHTLYVSGTHCPSCKIFIEDTLNEQPGIQKADVDLKNKTVSIVTTEDEGDEMLAEVLSKKITQNGYTLSVQKKESAMRSENILWQALPIGTGLLILFFLLQKSGILNIGIGGPTTPTTSFLIGLIASVSSCLAVVGGLVLSLSAKISQDSKSNTKTFALFHAGRLISFTVLGGVLGGIGSVISINYTFSAMMGIFTSIIMLFLGLNLSGLYKKNNITISPKFFNFLRRIEHTTYAPLALGFATFFLPCGFTQAMQVAALSSGSGISGSLIMGAFALGTLPMLAFLSYGSTTFSKSKHSALFFASIGIFIIGLSVFSLITGLAGLGIIPPIFSL